MDFRIRFRFIFKNENPCGDATELEVLSFSKRKISGELNFQRKLPEIKITTFLKSEKGAFSGKLEVF